MLFNVGSYVVHTKLFELGSGEIIKSELGEMSIRFASGTRSFSEAMVRTHLEITSDAPVMPPLDRLDYASAVARANAIRTCSERKRTC